MMKKKLPSFIPVVMLLLATMILVQCDRPTKVEQQNRPRAQPASAESRVPAYCESGPSLASLGPTLAPEDFKGQTRAAYQAVKEIPQTIAQLPCYCHCDKAMGHKSLHSCFEDEHAAHCAVCVNEALMAYHLAKEEGLDAAKIRERIIAEYSRQ